VNKQLNALITDVERSDIREDYAAMLHTPKEHHRLLGQWIETTAKGYTWNVLLSSKAEAQQVREAFFNVDDAPTTLMAVGGAVSRIMNEQDDDSEQTADIQKFVKLDGKKDYRRMLALCLASKYVTDIWRVLLGFSIKERNIMADDAKGVAEAGAVAEVVFRS
jgi:hypothetical protein